MESHKSHVPNHQPETQHLVSTRSVCGFWRTFNIEVLLNLSCSNPIESPLLWHFGLVSLSFFAPSHGLCFANPRTNGWGSGGACRNVFVCLFFWKSMLSNNIQHVYMVKIIYIYIYICMRCTHVLNITFKISIFLWYSNVVQQVYIVLHVLQRLQYTVICIATVGESKQLVGLALFGKITASYP